MSKYDWNLTKIKQAVLESINLSEVLDKMNIPRAGNNTKTLKDILDKAQIDYSHFTGRARKYNTNYIPAEEYLNSSKFITSFSLKEKLLKEGLKENKCEKCGITSWLGHPITVQLHHIDGNPHNNSLDNLMMLCPNCHSQTDNYCGNANKSQQKFYCKDCGKEISKGAVYCSSCSHIHKRKVERPCKEQLISDFKELKGFSQIGRKYEVSDNAVRKWFKYYDLPVKLKELKEILEI